MQVGAYADSFVEIATEKRLHYEQGLFAALEGSEEGARSVLHKQLLVVLCSDVLVLAEPRRESGAVRLIELIALRSLQLKPSSSCCLCVSSSSQPSVAFTLYASSAAEAQRWEALLKGQ
jgi:hypothetical protein